MVVLVVLGVLGVVVVVVVVVVAVVVLLVVVVVEVLLVVVVCGDGRVWRRCEWGLVVLGWSQTLTNRRLRARLGSNLSGRAPVH